MPRLRPRRVTAGALAAALVIGACGSGRHTASTGATATTTIGKQTAPPTTSSSAPPPKHVLTLRAALTSWQLPLPMSRSAAMTGSTAILVAGGLTTGDVSTAAIVQVDPAAGSAKRTGSLAVAVHDMGGAVLGGQAYAFGGGAASTIATVQRFPESGGSGATTGKLPKPRSDLAVAATADRAYIVGGFDGQAMDPDVLVTNDGATFTHFATLAVPVRYPAVAMAAGALWVIGGQLSTAESTKTGGQSDAIQRIDLRTGTTTVAGHLPTTLGHASAFALGDDVFVAGGQVVATPTDKVFHVDTATGAVTQAAVLPGPRSDAAAIVRDGVAWLMGGETTDPAHPMASVVELRPS